MELSHLNEASDNDSVAKKSSLDDILKELLSMYVNNEFPEDVCRLIEDKAKRKGVVLPERKRRYSRKEFLMKTKEKIDEIFEASSKDLFHGIEESVFHVDSSSYLENVRQLIEDKAGRKGVVFSERKWLDFHKEFLMKNQDKIDELFEASSKDLFDPIE